MIDDNHKAELSTIKRLTSSMQTLVTKRGTRESLNYHLKSAWHISPIFAENNVLSAVCITHFHLMKGWSE